MATTEVELFIEKVSVRIRELRIERNMTQLDLAIKSNVDERQIQRLENQQTSPTLKTIYKVANGLDIDLPTFFTFPKKMNKSRNSGFSLLAKRPNILTLHGDRAYLALSR